MKFDVAWSAEKAVRAPFVRVFKEGLHGERFGADYFCLDGYVG
jgi:hypothetical protein